MTIIHCSICEDAIDTSAEPVGYTDDGEPICGGCEEYLNNEEDFKDEEADDELDR